MYAYKGETIAAALIANGYKGFRYTQRFNLPRGVFCGIGQCTDCSMIVNGIPNVRTCVTRVEEGMIIETQCGYGKKGQRVLLLGEIFFPHILLGKLFQMW